MTHRQVMWEESWVNLMMKMRDMPYYRIKTEEEKEAEHTHEGTVEDIQKKFAKYIKP